ncbi:hypothetical protein DPMN_022989 [Dreissena polymorpha]|uniref:Uncharacterized protein n=1 Tax=Dreissena polymorpha TaxID=45954 RepID=A0A9D4LNS9_DREPO|nr:hypothetical protein DPMN_022989 [Dreissena polymorpha]
MFNNNTSVYKLWDTFKTDLTCAIHEHIPSKMKTNNTSTPWITRNVKAVIKKKACLYKKLKPQTTGQTTENFKMNARKNFGMQNGNT